MYLENDKCSIEIIEDETFTMDSVDNRHYDLILNPGGYKRAHSYKVLGIHIHLDASEMSLALIGPYYSSSVDCAILEDELLTVLLDDCIAQIDIRSGDIIRYIELDCFGTNLAIFRVDKGYLIHGEIEITMLDWDFAKKWSFSGRDIFVSISGEKAFEIRGDQIFLCDFENNRYVLDFNGKQVNK